MRGQELAGPAFVAVLTLTAVVAWSYVYVSADDTSAAAPPTAATASSAPGGSSGAGSDPDEISVVVVGDGLTDPQTQAGETFLGVAAERLGWSASVVEDGAGTGWLSRGPSEAGTFAERLGDQAPDDEVDLVVLQGGSADEPVLAANPTIPLGRAVHRTLRLAEEQYAEAELVVLGPVVAPSAGQVLRTIDETLGRVAGSDDATYVSPRELGWLAGADAEGTLDATTGLPDALGRERLADRLEAAVGDLPAS